MHKLSPGLTYPSSKAKTKHDKHIYNASLFPALIPASGLNLKNMYVFTVLHVQNIDDLSNSKAKNKPLKVQ